MVLRECSQWVLVIKLELKPSLVLNTGLGKAAGLLFKEYFSPTESQSSSQE